MPATITYFPFDDQASYEEQWRDMAENFMSSGVIVQGGGMDVTSQDCAVTPGTGLQVQVAVGKAWIKGHMFKHVDDYEFLPISPNSSGSTRTDLVVIRADFTANTISYQVLEGTTTPTRTSTVYDLPLATVSVANGAVSISSSDIADKRVSANHHTFSPAVQLTNSTNTAVGASATVALTWNLERIDNTAIHSTSSNTDKIIIKESGIYQVTAMVYWRRTGAGLISGQMEMSVYQDSGVTVRQFIRDSRYMSLSNGVQSASQIIDLAAGDILYVQVSNTTASTDVIIDAAQPYSPYFSIVKLATSSGI